MMLSVFEKVTIFLKDVPYIIFGRSRNIFDFNIFIFIDSIIYNLLIIFRSKIIFDFTSFFLKV